MCAHDKLVDEVVRLPTAAASGSKPSTSRPPVMSSGVAFYPPSDRLWRIGGKWYDFEPFLKLHPGGAEVYHFPSGQTEAHGLDGYKEILFPDGLLRRVYPDGREEDQPTR